MSADDHFSSIAEKYNRGRFGYPAELYRKLAALCPTRDCAWDCACGSGQATVDLIAHFDHVIASDISVSLLAQMPAHPKITTRVSSAEDSGLPAASVDLITVAQAIHWFDQSRFWIEANRVLKPQGILAFWGYIWPQVDDEIDRLLEEFKQAIAPYWPERNKLLQDRYHSIRPSMLELSMPAFVIVQNWQAENYLGHLHSWSAVKYYHEQRGANPITKYRADIETAWGTNPKAARWPLVLRVFRKA